jgi:CO/xanthine dehydrogenase Mo-binding subunit
MDGSAKVLGAGVRRKDALEKVTGAIRYVDDIVYPGALFGGTVRTRSPGGLIEGIEFDPAIDWSQYVVVTAADVPGENRIRLIDPDQPALAQREFRHAAEPVVLLAHADRHALARGLAGVRVVETPNAYPVFDIDEALQAAHPICPGNVFRDYRMLKGDPALGAAQAQVVFEGRFETGAQEHVYIEPQGMIAHVDAAGVLVIEGSMQCPFYVQDTLLALTDRTSDRLRIVHRTTGGGFGGKEEYPSHIAAHAALLTLKAHGRPVRLIYDRAEDMLATPKRHPSRSIVRLGAKRDGTLTLIDFDYALDGGAYTTLSPVVLSRGLIHAPGPYRCEHVNVRGRAVATNHPPNGAFRGFGAPQAIFAMEVALDGLARELGMTPLELRRRNMLQPGDMSAPGQLMDESMDFRRVLDEGLARSDYVARREAHARSNAQAQAEGSPLRRGIGLATFYHGAGFTGGGEVYLASKAAVRAHADGQVEILASSSEMGQGSSTTLCQIVAQALELPIEQVSQAAVDTHAVLNSGPTVASRTCMVVGRILEDAARQLRGRLEHEGGLPAGSHTPEQFAQACARMLEGGGELVVESRYEPPPNVNWDEKAFRGSPYASYAWAAYLAEVEIDLRTFEVRLTDFVAVQEIGKVVNPVIAAGQVEGGVVQALGYALLEKVVWGANGAMANNRITNYIIPTSADTPPIRVYFQEQPGGTGPSGAKGLGELPMDGPGPAIVNAINFALDTRIAAVPVLPEDVMQALDCAAAASARG